MWVLKEEANSYCDSSFLSQMHEFLLQKYFHKKKWKDTFHLTTKFVALAVHKQILINVNELSSCPGLAKTSVVLEALC